MRERTDDRRWRTKCLKQFVGLGENGREQDLNAGENTRALAGVEYKFIMKGTIQIFWYSNISLYL